MAIGDLDSDETPDLAVANTGWYPTYEHSATVLLNQRPMPGNIDGDGDVGLSDFAPFVRQFSGSQ